MKISNINLYYTIQIYKMQMKNLEYKLKLLNSNEIQIIDYYIEMIEHRIETEHIQ